MKTTPTFSQLLAAVAAAPSAAIADSLFQQVYACIREHYYNAFYSLCYKEFNLDKSSIVAEEVYYQVLEETKEDILTSRFDFGRYFSDEVAKRGLVRWMLWKANRRLTTALKSRRKKVVSAADLSPSQSEVIEGVAQQDFSDLMDEAMRYTFKRLSKKEADIIRTCFLEAISEEDARRILMQEYRIPTDSAFKQAVARAKRRFKELLQNYKAELTTTSQ